MPSARAKWLVEDRAHRVAGGPQDPTGHPPAHPALIAVATRPESLYSVAGAWPAQTRRLSGRAGARMAMGSAGP